MAKKNSNNLDTELELISENINTVEDKPLEEKNSENKPLEEKPLADEHIDELKKEVINEPVEDLSAKKELESKIESNEKPVKFDRNVRFERPMKAEKTVKHKTGEVICVAKTFVIVKDSKGCGHTVHKTGYKIGDICEY